MRELAAALMDMGQRPDGLGKASVEELVLAGVRARDESPRKHSVPSRPGGLCCG